MDLHALEGRLQELVLGSVASGAVSDRAALAEQVRSQIEQLPREVRRELGDAERDRLVGRVCDFLLGFGPLQSLMDDPEVTEIMVLAPDTIFIERKGRKSIASPRFQNPGQVRVVVERMMRDSGRRLDESNPYCDFSLPDGSRVHVIIPPLAYRCPQITIRKFLDTIRGVDDLVGRQTLDHRMAGFLTACIRARKNLLFSGATGSGKTTTLSALSAAIDPQERIVTIEDTRELHLRQQHVVSLITRPPNIEGTGEVSLRDLMRNSLRMRPSRILLGEIRGAEAMEFLQALTSGHRGCSAVLHASSPADSIHRLETLALYAGLQLPVRTIREQIVSGLDVIIQHEQQSDGTRKITHVTEVAGMDEGEVQLRDLFRYTLLSTGPQGEVNGEFRAVAPVADPGYFEARGVELPAAWFEEASG